MPVDWSTLHKVLRDETRKKILLNLQSAGSLAYTDLLNRLQIANTGKLNYHLKMLNDLIAKDEHGAYTLTDSGGAAAELLGKFPSQIADNKPLRAFDAALIGILGLVLTLAPLIVLLIPSTLIVFFGYPLALLYLILVPAYVMNRLTVARTHLHDFYDLVKPPAVGATIFYGFLLLIVLLQRFYPNEFDLGAIFPEISTGCTTTGNVTTCTGIQFTGLGILPWPVFAIIGVFVIEGIYRYRNR